MDAIGIFELASFDCDKLIGFGYLLRNNSVDPSHERNDKRFYTSWPRSGLFIFEPAFAIKLSCHGQLQTHICHVRIIERPPVFLSSSSATSTESPGAGAAVLRNRVIPSGWL